MEKFVIKSGKHHQFFFQLKADNGEILLLSEKYHSKASCVHSIDAVKINAKLDSHYDRLKAADEQYYFTIKAANGDVIAKSGMYKDAAGRNTVLEMVKTNAATAPVVEE
jgi:uncharacterized protein YegP (UPF0339 family)